MTELILDYPTDEAANEAAEFLVDGILALWEESKADAGGEA